jgi:hypothetical protein
MRLLHHYELSLRHWGQVLLPPVTATIGARARLAAEDKKKAIEERNAANDLMFLHKRT